MFRGLDNWRGKCYSNQPFHRPALDLATRLGYKKKLHCWVQRRWWYVRAHMHSFASIIGMRAYLLVPWWSLFMFYMASLYARANFITSWPTSTYREPQQLVAKTSILSPPKLNHTRHTLGSASLFAYSAQRTRTNHIHTTDTSTVHTTLIRT